MPNQGQGYIGAIEIDESGNQILIGSTLYGDCATGAYSKQKIVTLTQFDGPVTGITIQVKFINGNNLLLTNDNDFTLQVGSTNPYPIKGNCVCDPGGVVEFTLEFENSNYAWRSHGGIKIETDNNNIVTKIAGQEINVATKTYVDNATGGLSGLTGAMHFKGSVNSLPEETAQETFSTYDAGDVVLTPDHKEYVYNKKISAAESLWIELGDEGSYVLKTSQTTDVIDEVTSWTDGTLPTLTVTNTSVSNVSVTTAGSEPSATTQQVSIPNVTQAGTATTASVTGGILNITLGQDTRLGSAVTIISTPVTVGSASGWTSGTMPTLSQTPTTVLVPVVNSNP